MGDNFHCCNYLRLKKKAHLQASQPPFLGLNGERFGDGRLPTVFTDWNHASGLRLLCRRGLRCGAGRRLLDSPFVMFVELLKNIRVKEALPGTLGIVGV